MMTKNIVLGALAGAAIAWLITEERKHKGMEHAYHHIGDYLMDMKRKMKMKAAMHKVKGEAGCMSEQAMKKMHGYMNR
ncbi:MAG: hypothetical protein LUE98_12585 [Tannerellaceae bacterium]|nr:hypothetical protein [Tannerellaceae bacterium]